MNANPFHVTAALKAGDLVYAKRSSSGHFKAGQEFKVQHYRASRYYNDPAIVSVWDGKAIRQFEEEWLVTKKPNFNVGDDVVDKQSPQTPLGHVRSIKKFDDQSKEWIYEVRQSNGFTDWLESELVASQVGGLPTGQPQQVTFNYGDRVRVRTNTGKISPSPTAAYAGEEGEIVGIVGNGPHYQVKFDKQIGRLNQWQSIHADDLELWQQDETKQQAAPQTEDRKSQVADRIYDITLSGKPEDHEGELQELFAEWKQMTGRDKPRFLEGRKIKAQPSSKAAGSRFVIGDQVMTASGSGKVQSVWWDNGINNWMYEINIPGHGTAIRTETALMKHSQNQGQGHRVGQGMSSGDIVYLTKSVGPPHDIGTEFKIVAPFGKHQYEVQPTSGGSRTFIDESKLTKDKPKFKIGDQVQIGQHTAEVTGYYDYEIAGGMSLGGWSYDVEFTSGQYKGHTSNNIDERNMKLIGAQAGASNQARFKEGDRVEIASHGGEEGMVVADEGSGTYRVFLDGNYRTRSVTVNANDLKLLPVQPKFRIGDLVYVDRQNTGAKNEMGVIVAFAQSQPDDDGVFWYVVEHQDASGRGKGFDETIDEDSLRLVGAGDEQKQTQQNKFKPGDVVQGIGAEHDNPHSAKVLKPVMYQGEWAYELEWNHGLDVGIVPESQLKLKQQTQQEQHDQRQRVDPDQQPRQTFHPSQQELMSHIKDKGTPYFPPTPEGQKAFEEYLIKQHNDFYENLKRNWGMLIKKFGKKGQLMVRKEKDALYAAAMARHLT